MMKPTIVAAGVCSVLFCTQSMAAAPAAAVKTAKQPQTPQFSKAVTSHRTEVDSRYAEQDKELMRADQLVKGGRDEDYEAALKIYQDVHMGLELEVGSLESWIARRRFNEIGTRLDAIRLEYGNKKLREAKNAFNEGRYGEAADLAGKVSSVCPALNENAAEIRRIARSRQKGEERLLAVSADTLIPKLRNDESNIAREIAEARVLMKKRKFEEARRRIENVYKINPFNQEAAYLASQIYAQYYTAGYHRSQADARSMMASEAWQWVEPVFYRDIEKQDIEEGQVKSTGDQKIQAQLDSIIIPSVKYDATNISSVVTHLMSSSKRFDDNGKGTGVIIDYIAPTRNDAAIAVQQKNPANNDGENLDENPEENANTPAAPAAPAIPVSSEKEIFVTLNVNNASLREILDYISFLTDLPYRIYPERVVIGALGSDVKREVFRVTPEAVAIITGDQGNAQGAEAGADDGAAVAAAGGDAGGDGGELIKGDVLSINITPDDLKKFFGDFGIDFNTRGSNINYLNGKITMTNTQENLNLMDRLIRQLNTVSEMVQIELKSIEISESDMEELGFNWSLGTLERTNSGSSWELAQGINARVGKALDQLSSSITGNASTLVDKLSIFPDLFGSIKPFGSDVGLNLSLTINALDRNDRSEMISAPSVTVANNATARVELTTNYFFPDSWEELEVELSSGDDDGDGVNITAPMPEFDEESKIGTIFSVTPKIKKNNIIGLSIHPDVTSYIGKDSEMVSAIIEERNASGEWEPGSLSRTFEVWKPVISHRKLDLEVNVKNGETLVLGGLSDSQMQTRLDKIPILGDIPFIGRLFQSQSEVSTRKNMLIFVTARLVNDAGLPTNELLNDGGIPDVNR